MISAEMSKCILCGGRSPDTVCGMCIPSVGDVVEVVPDRKVRCDGCGGNIRRRTIAHEMFTFEDVRSVRMICSVCREGIPG